MDLVEGTLSHEGQEELLKSANGDDEIRSSLTAFSKIATLESIVNSEEFALSDDFADETMRKLDDRVTTGQDLPSYRERVREALRHLWECDDSGMIRASAALATLVIIVGLTIHSAGSILNSPAHYSQSTEKPASAANTQRLNVIESRVDVVLTYSEKGKMTSKVIVPNVRLMNSSGYSTLTIENPIDQERAVMTLDVTAKESHSIKSALEVGTVSFLFYG
jgi:hypothetical protein